MKNSEISYYMELVLKSKFPQFHLLTPRNFVEELRKREIHIFERDLEYFDKKGILRPCLRLNRPIVNFKGQKYGLSSLNSLHNWKKLYNEGYIEFSKDGDFKSWKCYLDGNEEKTWLFYHPWQILFVRDQTFGEISRIKGRSFLSRKFDCRKFVSYERKSYRTWLSTMKKKSQEAFNPIIGLLMLLDEPYHTELTHRFYPIPDDSKSYFNWQKWKNKKHFPKKFLSTTGFTIEKLKVIYHNMVFDADHLDPINMWNPLPQIIRRGKRRKLTGNALLAQDYFDALQMIAYFIKDLTGEEMPTPYDSGPWETGWKEMIYGNPYDLNSVKTRNRVLSDFITERPIITSIIYEGDTEDKVIREIMKSVDVYNPEKQGIHLYNVKGSGNMNQKNLDGYIIRANLDENDVYVIIDKDAESYLKKHVEEGAIKQEMCTIWKKDFESDNFGMEIVVNKINHFLKEKGKVLITTKEVEHAMKNRKLFDAVKWLVYKKNKLELEKNGITKPNLAMSLLRSRFKEIRNEYLGKEWNPIFPIEKVLKSILRTVPKYVDYE